MNIKKIFLAVAFVAAFLFVSCSPNSSADDDALYGEKSGINPRTLKAKKGLAQD